LDLWIINIVQQFCSVATRILPLLLIHDLLPKGSGLIVVISLSFVPEMAFTADNVITEDIRCPNNIRVEFVCKAVWRILLVSGMICVDAELTIEVQG
jgi:hypothetical protein